MPSPRSSTSGPRLRCATRLVVGCSNASTSRAAKFDRGRMGVTGWIATGPILSPHTRFGTCAMAFARHWRQLAPIHCERAALLIAAGLPRRGAASSITSAQGALALPPQALRAGGCQQRLAGNNEPATQGPTGRQGETVLLVGQTRD